MTAGPTWYSAAEKARRAIVIPASANAPRQIVIAASLATVRVAVCARPRRTAGRILPMAVASVTSLLFSASDGQG